ncbi:MAG: Lsr2 family protein [Rhodococcus sp.]|uniref:histone-like nucleoid-structuring protein Lsr2 n=1 Tax=Rhodococcus TaxID=1827 RepID=UPI0016915668|nr:MULTISPECIES: Lsr2 family protein [Rhodococcus]NLV81252.1 Lsr2 family protein [Rhodococcus sp. (in: high G+C Gram-positive bacteria)]
MAQRVQVEYFDDIDGEPIAEGLAQSIRIAIDDVEYELDLRPANADRFWAQLEPWLKESRRNRAASPAIPPTTPTPVPARTGRPRTHKIIPGRSPEQLAAIRHWARGQGYEVSSRGRIPAHILDRFEAAHS